MGEGNPERKTEQVLPGIEALGDADLAVFFMRFLKLPDQEWQPIEDYLKSGKPVQAKLSRALALESAQRATETDDPSELRNLVKLAKIAPQ